MRTEQKVNLLEIQTNIYLMPIIKKIEQKCSAVCNSLLYPCIYSESHPQKTKLDAVYSHILREYIKLLLWPETDFSID